MILRSRGRISLIDNLQVTSFSAKDTCELAKLARRAMKLQINVQDGDVMVSIGDAIAYMSPLKWKSAA
jgi:uncharacterized protein YaeQ